MAGTYALDRIDHEVKYIAPSGAVKRAYLFEWQGFARSEATWQETGFGSEAILQEDIRPLRSKLMKRDMAEVAEHHRITLQMVQRVLWQALEKGYTKWECLITIMMQKRRCCFSFIPVPTGAGWGGG